MKKIVIFGSILVVAMFLFIPSSKAITVNDHDVEINKPVKNSNGIIPTLWWIIVLARYDWIMAKSYVWHELAGFKGYFGDMGLYERPLFLLYSIFVEARAWIWLYRWINLYEKFGWEYTVPPYFFP